MYFRCKENFIIIIQARWRARGPTLLHRQFQQDTGCIVRGPDGEQVAECSFDL